jgi:hypothetical protein
VFTEDVAPVRVQGGERSSLQHGIDFLGDDEEPLAANNG